MDCGSDGEGSDSRGQLGKKKQLHRANSYTLMTPQSAGISGAAYVEEEQKDIVFIYNIF